MAVVLLTADDASEVRWLVLGLCAADLTVNTIDILAEPSSRAPLGGLPRLEYLAHVLATFAVGAAAATFWWAADHGGTALTTSEKLRIAGAAATTVALLATETTLFTRSRLRARAAGHRHTLRANLAACCG